MPVPASPLQMKSRGRLGGLESSLEGDVLVFSWRRGGEAGSLDNSVLRLKLFYSGGDLNECIF